MRTKFLLKKCAVVLALCFGVMGMTNLNAQTFTYGDFNYQINDGGVSVTVSGHVDGNDATGELNLPESVRYNGVLYSVTKIKKNAFRGCKKITSITIPSSINQIGEEAFYGCILLKTVKISDIESWCRISFFRNSTSGLYDDKYTSNPLYYAHKLYVDGSLIHDLTIPEGVTYINNAAFISATTIRTVYIPSSVQSIGMQAFDGCTGLKSIEIPNTVSTIGPGAFKNCTKITSLTIPESVAYIGGGAFCGCSDLTIVNYNAVDCELYYDIFSGQINSIFDGCIKLNTINIGSNVASLSPWLVADCPSITKIYISNIVSWCDIQFNGGTLFTSGITPYLNDSPLMDLVIPDGVTSISSYAFAGATCIKSISLPNSLTEIGEGAFWNCSGLEGTLNIPNSVTSIGAMAFLGCIGFTSLMLPVSVTLIDTWAFQNCSGLTGAINIPTSTTYIGQGAFSGCSGITKVEYNAINCTTNMYHMYQTAFENCLSLNEISIGNAVQTIPDYMFMNCSNLNTISVLCTTPPTLGTDVFTGISPVANLFVPCGTQMAYFSNWNVFDYNNIHEDCTPRTITISPNITGGTVTASTPTATFGQVVTLNVNPDQGYELQLLVVYNANNPSQLVSTTNNTFVMPQYNVFVEASFRWNSVDDHVVIMASVYPNPTNNVVKIEAENIKNIRIYNLLGELLLESSASGTDFEYDLSNNEAGIYLVRIETAQGIITKRVTVM